MTRILSILLLALFAASPAYCEVWQARYGVAETFNFRLYNADGTLDVDESDGGTEVSLSCNEGAETTATNDFVDEGTFYSIALTSGEMQCERIAVVVAATTIEVFFIQTIGNASAMTPVYEANAVTVGPTGSATAQTARDIGASVLISPGTGTGQLSVTSGVIAANEVQISGDSGAADTLETWLDGTAGPASPLGIVRQGTAQAYTAGTPSLTLDSAAAFGDNTLTGTTAMICGSTQGYCQEVTIASNVGSTDVATLSAALPVAATGTITFYIFGTAASTGGSGLDAAGVRAAIGLASANLDTQLDALPTAAENATANWAAGTRSLTILDEDSTTIDLNASYVGGVTVFDEDSTAIDINATTLGTVTTATTATNLTNLPTIPANWLTAAGAAADFTTEVAAGLPTVAGISDGVWDEALAGHVGAGSTGEALNAAGGAGDPWITTLPGSYTSGQAGYILGTNLNATVSSRASQASVDDVPTNAELATSQAAADDATLAAVAALNNLSSAQAQTAAAAALSAYDPPTRAEATSDANSILLAVDVLNDLIGALHNLSAANVRDIVIEDQGGSVTLGCAISVVLAYAAGDVSTSGANSTYRDPSNTETRITGTVTSAGNRAASVTCPSF